MFTSLFRADTNAGDRSTWGDFWFSPLGGRSASGQAVNARTAVQNATVYACVKVLSESFMQLPFKLYAPKVGGGRTQKLDHWMVRLLRRPNPLQNGVEWRQMMQGHLALRGNAYNIVTPDGAGGIASLLPVHPDRMTVEPLSSGSWRYRRTLPDGSQVYLTREDVWHLRAMSDDGIVGMSPIEAMRDVIGSALGAQEYASRFWANDGKPTGGWIEYPGRFATDEAKRKFRESLQRATSGGNRHRTMVLEGGMKYHEVGLSNKDSQFLEARQFTRTELCAIWRVPPTMVQDHSRSTYSNMEQASLDFWQGTMLPWVVLWECALADLLAENEQDWLPVFDYRSLMRGDAASRAEYASRLVLGGIMTRNEAREMEGLDPIEGLDEPLVPVNEMTLTESEEPDEPVTPPGVGSPAKEAPEDSADASRLAALVRSGADRMARRLAKGDAPSAGLLAEAIGVPVADAEAWLARFARDPGDDVEQISMSLCFLAGFVPCR